MKKFIILTLFLLNFAFVFEHGKLEVTMGLEMRAQTNNSEVGDGYSGSTCSLCHNPSDKCTCSFEVCKCQYCKLNCNECNNSCQTCMCGCTTPYCSGLHCYSDCPNGSSPCQFCGTCGCTGQCQNNCPDGNAPCDYCQLCGCHGECLFPTETPVFDCNSIEGGTAYMDQCGECVGGNTGKTACIPIENNNPCKDMLNSLSSPQIQSQYKALAEKLKANAEKEWGTEIFAKYDNATDWMNCTGIYSTNVPSIREGEDHSFEPNWKDDYANLNRILGYMHTHPSDETCFSPADIEVFLKLNSDRLNLEKRSKDAIAMALTPSTNYILKIDDWTKLRDLDPSVLSGLRSTFEKRVLDYGQKQEKVFMDLYVNNPAMKGIFNVFKTDPSGKPGLLSTDANGNTINTPCN